jgi:hypothetical protein
MKVKYRWLNRRVSKPGPFLTLCLTEEEQHHATRKLLKKNLDFPAYGAICHTFGRDSSNELCAIVSVSLNSQQNGNAIEIAGLLIHEAVHVWQRYAEDIGEKNPGSEQEAYAIQGISQELMAEYARRISK